MGLRDPEHLDRWVRNERLYRHLLGLGLVAIPVFEDGDRVRMDHILVSSEWPLQARQGIPEGGAMGSVALPMEGAAVGYVVGAAEPCRNGVVVDFPTVR